MPFELPRPIDPTEAMRENLRQRLAILGGPNADAELGQILGKGLGNLGESAIAGLMEKKKRASVEQAMSDASTLMRMTPEQRSADPMAVERGNRGFMLLGLGGQLLKQSEQPSIANIEAEAAAKARGTASVKPQQTLAEKVAEKKAIYEATRTGGQKPAPPGYQWRADGKGLEAIPGGPAAVKADALGEKETAAQNSALEQADAQIVKVDQALKNVSGWSTGWGGAIAGRFPGSQAKDLQGDLDTIKANLGFSTLAEMKRASPTGGALGAISESEMRLLTSARESLDREQSKEQLIRNLKAVKTHYTNWRNAVEKSRSGGGQEAPSGGGAIALTGDKAKRLAELRARAASR